MAHLGFSVKGSGTCLARILGLKFRSYVASRGDVSLEKKEAEGEDRNKGSGLTSKVQSL